MPDTRRSDSQPTDLMSAEEHVRLTVPASASFASVLRTVTASLAARRDFTIEEIDDLRIAIDEACALLLPFAPDGGDNTLTAEFAGPPNRLYATLTLSDPDAGAAIDETAFAWLVLAAVSDSVRTTHDGDSISIAFEKNRLPHD